jgi:hypothetical protein
MHLTAFNEVDSDIMTYSLSFEFNIGPTNKRNNQIFEYFIYIEFLKEADPFELSDKS